jgi:hypothetical protein
MVREAHFKCIPTQVLRILHSGGSSRRIACRRGPRTPYSMYYYACRETGPLVCVDHLPIEKVA